MSKTLTDMGFRQYRKAATAWLMPYTPENTFHLSISNEDREEVMGPGPYGMIGINPHNFEDRWYIAKKFFEANYEAI